MLKFLLLPVALGALLFAAMPAQIMASALYREWSWNAATATVARAETLCRLTYQPADTLLRKTAATGPCEDIRKTRLPAGASKPKVYDDLHGALDYVAGGRPLRWEGRLADAGVYNVTAGMKVPLLYDPADPARLDSAQMKGWPGALAIMLGTGGFVVFYGWFFWLRRT